jgi:iron-sulfur cluster repair protein YtfE (RIC family)
VFTIGSTGQERTMAESLAEALEREHHEIDDGLAAFAASPATEQDALRRAIAALRRHIYLEEEVLFPPLHRAGLMAPVLVMLREHGQMWRTLDALLLELRTDPAGSGVKELLRELAAQLQHHNLKEERILYPQADTALDDESAARLQQLLATGELPDGWTCAQA